MAEPSVLNRFRGYVAVFGLIAIVVLNASHPPATGEWAGPLFFLALIAAADLVAIPLPKGYLSVAFAVLFPLFLFYGTTLAVTVFTAGMLIGHLITRPRPVLRALFNAAQLGLSCLAGSIAYSVLTRESVMAFGPGLAARPGGMAVFIGAYLIVNHLFVNLSIQLQSEGRLGLRPLLVDAVEPMKSDLLVRVLTTPLGIALAWMYSVHGIWGAAVVSIPLLFVSYIFRLHFGLSMANRELTILYDVAQRVGSVLQLEKLFDLIAEAVSRVVQYDVCSLYLWDDIKRELALMMVKQPVPGMFGGSTVQLGQGVVGSVALNREPELVADAARDQRASELGKTEGDPRSLLVVPLIVDDELVGAIAVGHRNPGAFTSDHLRLLTILGSQAAVAIENAILYRRTEQLAVTDPMTGLFNYRYLYVKLGDEMKKARLGGYPVALIYLDLDNFKQCNDTYGHLAGDRVLKEFSDIVRDNIRDNDTPVRYAGDEFVVVLSNADQEEAKRVAERIREAVAQRAFLAGEAVGLRLTVSAGIAAFPDNASSEAELICRADQAMYRGKGLGTNQVCVSR